MKTFYQFVAIFLTIVGVIYILTLLPIMVVFLSLGVSLVAVMFYLFFC